MSWAAHQFEYYALQGHLPRRWLGKISFLGIVVGDHSCDLVGKLWSYGFDIGGTHYGPEEPAQWHRGWPGLGVTHSVFWAFVVAGIVYLVSRDRSWTLGVGLGAAIHVITDFGDTVGRCSPSRSAPKTSPSVRGPTPPRRKGASTGTARRTTAAGAS